MSSLYFFVSLWQMCVPKVLAKCKIILFNFFGPFPEKIDDFDDFVTHLTFAGWDRVGDKGAEY